MSRGQPLELRFLDCGLGESTILKFPDGSVGVVDCFYQDPLMSAQATTCLDEMLGKDGRFRFVCLSHPHWDHYTGMHDLIERFKDRIEEFWHSGTYYKAVVSHIVQDLCPTRSEFERSSKELHEIYRLLGRRKGDPSPKIIDLTEGRDLTPAGRTCGGVSIRALAPGPGGWRTYLSEVGQFRGVAPSGGRFRTREPDRNHISNALYLEHGKAHVVLGGDVLRSVWRWLGVSDLVNQPPPVLPFLLIKAPHHGSTNAFAPEFYYRRVVKNMDAHVIICGRDPAMAGQCDKLLALSRELGLTVHFVPDGGTYRVYSNDQRMVQALDAASAPVSEPTNAGTIARLWPDGSIKIDRFP